jgi:hypothetical protein
MAGRDCGFKVKETGEKYQRSEDRGQKSEVGDQRSEVRRQNGDFGLRNSELEIRRNRPYRGQRSEVRSQTTASQMVMNSHDDELTICLFSQLTNRPFD